MLWPGAYPDSCTRSAAARCSAPADSARPEPDQGWCSGAIIFDVEQGNADGVDLSGRKVVVAAEWPGDFWGGNGTARLYVDEAASPEQHRELEAIFGGKKGGPLEPVWNGVFAKWLPAQTARIDIQWGDTSSATVGDVGQLKSERMKNEAGQPATVQGAAAMAAFQTESTQVARTAGSRWSDPEMRRWEGDSGVVSSFSWSGCRADGRSDTARPASAGLFFCGYPGPIRWSITDLATASVTLIGKWRGMATQNWRGPG